MDNSCPWLPRSGKKCIVPGSRLMGVMKFKKKIAFIDLNQLWLQNAIKSNPNKTDAGKWHSRWFACLRGLHDGHYLRQVKSIEKWCAKSLEGQVHSRKCRITCKNQSDCNQPTRNALMPPHPCTIRPYMHGFFLLLHFIFYYHNVYILYSNDSHHRHRQSHHYLVIVSIVITIIVSVLMMIDNFLWFRICIAQSSIAQGPARSSRNTRHHFRSQLHPTSWDFDSASSRPPRPCHPRDFLRHRWHGGQFVPSVIWALVSSRWSNALRGRAVFMN